MTTLHNSIKTSLDLPVSVESLTNHTLFQIRLRKYGGKRANSGKAAEYSRNEGAKTNVYNLTEDLFVNDAGLRKIGLYRQNIDNWVRRLAYPFGDGLWFLPAYRTPQFMTEFAQHETKYMQMVDDWLSAYEDRISAAAFERGSLFKRSDYLTKDQVRSRFSIRLFLFDVPQGHFAVQAENDLRDSMHKHFNKQYQDQIKVVLDKQAKQLTKVMTSLSNTLTTTVKTNKKGKQITSKGRVHKTTLETAKELSSMFRGFNMADDPALDSAATQLQAALDGVNIEHLRSETVRNRVKSSVDSILHNFLPAVQAIQADAASVEDADEGDDELDLTEMPIISMFDEVVPKEERLTAKAKTSILNKVFDMGITEEEEDLLGKADIMNQITFHTAKEFDFIEAQEPDMTDIATPQSGFPDMVEITNLFDAE
jgi:hypothetical protein